MQVCKYSREHVCFRRVLWQPRETRDNTGGPEPTVWLPQSRHGRAHRQEMGGVLPGSS